MMGDKRRRRGSRKWIWGVILGIAVLSTFAIRQSEVIAAKKRLAALESEIEYYRNMNETLERQAELLSSDEYIEKTAREKLGLVKPGEIQYMLVNDNPGP